MSTALITVALSDDGAPTVASSGITKARALPMARALAELQAQLLAAATAPEPEPTPELAEAAEQES